MIIFVTGSAGFIGFHITRKLIREGFKVVGFDNVNSYYDISLKEERIKELQKESKKFGAEFIFIKGDLTDKGLLRKLFQEYSFKKVINLAAQAGVRYSIENPSAYIQSNIVGFSNILEECKLAKVEHLIYASSSSVYGGNKELPFSEKHGVNHPVSLYAASKRSNELMAHTYSHLYGLPTTGLRFFTVYGPWGRPDMALFLFTKAILSGEEINVYNNGDMVRDFTFIDDVTEAIYRLIEKTPKPFDYFNEMNLEVNNSWSPFKIFNVGNSQPVTLIQYINEIEKELGIKAKMNHMPIQPGDVKTTSADTNSLESYINFKPRTSISKGVKEFIKWYREFYNK